MFTHRMFIGGYANNATFYLPFILVWLISSDETRFNKSMGLATLVVGFGLVFLYSHRTAMIAIPVATFIIFLLTRQYKVLLAVCSLAVVAAVAVGLSRTEVLERYRSLGDPTTYVTNQGVSGRYAVWEGALQIIKERPIAGYGYGW